MSKNNLDKIDQAILCAYYMSFARVGDWRPALTMDDLGHTILPRAAGVTRTRSLVHHRITTRLVDEGYLERNENSKTAPYYITEKGKEYVEGLNIDWQADPRFADSA